jgi:hypothetical protein
LWGCRKRKDEWRGKMKKERKREGMSGLAAALKPYADIFADTNGL